MDFRQFLITRSSRLFMIDRAREAAQGAISHRGFKVGCSVMAWRRSEDIRRFESDQWVFTGANYKPTRGAESVCAERNAIEKARHHRYGSISAICVAGIPQFDEISRLLTLTLHPCHNCRRMLESDPLIMPDAILIAAHLNKDFYIEMPVADLAKLHREESGLIIPQPVTFPSLEEDLAKLAAQEAFIERTGLRLCYRDLLEP